MSHSGSWSPYAGGSAIVLAIVLFVVTGALLYVAARLSHPVAARRPGPFLGVLLIVSWLVSVVTFLVASTTYVWALLRQVGHITAPQNPITPVTLISAFLAFAAIVVLAQRSGFWVAFGSAVVGTIAAPMIFELPFDLIVMGHTYPPAPATLFTLLYFLPLFLIEISSFAMLTFSPLLRLSRYTLVLLAGMFFIFAVWAVFGFAYPSAPLPTALNMISKMLAFAAAVSLFLPEGSIASIGKLAREDVGAAAQAPQASGLV
jgi:hypothetical protein